MLNEWLLRNDLYGNIEKYPFGLYRFVRNDGHRKGSPFTMSVDIKARLPTEGEDKYMYLYKYGYKLIYSP